MPPSRTSYGPPPPPWGSFSSTPTLESTAPSVSDIADTMSSLSIPNNVLPPGVSVTHMMKPKLIKRFQEPLIMLESLYKLLNRTTSTATATAERHHETLTARNPLEANFQSFLNRLSEVLDSKPGGSTVTAVLVQEVYHKRRYWIASNERNQEHIDEAGDFMINLLSSIDVFLSQPAGEVEVESATLEILTKVLKFNRKRLTSYMNAFSTLLKKILQSRGERVKAPRELLSMLVDIDASNNIAKPEGGENLESYVARTQKLLKDLESRRGLELEVSKMAKVGQMDVRESWAELRHYLGRLLHYRKAVGVLMAAHRQWPDLFTDFTVHAVASPKEEKNPLDRTPTAHAIIGRMTSDAEEKQRYCDLADRFQMLNPGLDSFIKDRCGKGPKSPKPILHAELLVFDAFWRCQDAGQRTFFQNWKYIGTSKGACLLCDYFFDGHSSGVRVRRTHGNVYLRWRFPHPTMGVSSRETLDGACSKMVNRVLAKLRQEVFNTLDRGERPTGRNHDSSTNMTPYPYMLQREMQEMGPELLDPIPSSSLSSSSSDDGKTGALKWDDSVGDITPSEVCENTISIFGVSDQEAQGAQKLQEVQEVQEVEQVQEVEEVQEVEVQEQSEEESESDEEEGGVSLH